MDTSAAVPGNASRQHAAAQRALNRGVGLARVSGLCLMVAGAISTLLCLLDPLSAGMVISLAVLANGIIEWRGGGRLRRLNSGAADALASNQIALGIEIALYALWRAKTVNVAAIEEALRLPLVQSTLELYPPEVVAQTKEMLPALIRGVFLIVAVIAVLGCVVMALYYRSRRKHVATLAAPAAGASAN